MGLGEITVEPTLHIAVITDLVIRRQHALLSKQPIGLHRIGHRRGSAEEGHLPRLPTADPSDADGNQQHGSAGQMAARLAFEAPTNQRRVEVRVGRLLQRAAEGRAQLLGVLLPGADLCRHFHVTGQKSLHQASVVIIELVVHIRVQVTLARGHADHLSLRREGRVISPSLSWRKAWRARDRRDMTVPTGTSRISATSL